MPQPFTNVVAQPAFGNSSTMITWSVNDLYDDGEFYIYRSPTGVDKSDDWILLNDDDPVQNVSFYEDTTQNDKSKWRSYYYRVLLKHNNNYYDSPIIGTFSEQLTKSQFGALYKMRRMEFLRMRHNGVPVMYCIPSVEGEKSLAYNKYTNSIAGTDCIDPDAFGTWFDEGIKTIIQTRVELSQLGPMDIKQDAEGAMDSETQVYQLRLLAFPTPEVGHIVVLPYADLRLVITGNIQPYYLRGFLPVAFDAQAIQLKKDDPRYGLDLPPLRLDGPFDKFKNQRL